MQRKRMTQEQIQANREQARQRMRAGNHPVVQAARDALVANRDTGQGQMRTGGQSGDAQDTALRPGNGDLSGQMAKLAANRVAAGRGTQEGGLSSNARSSSGETPLPRTLMNLMGQKRR